METLEEKITRALKDKIEIVPYDACWPEFFEAEKNHLQKTLPPEMIQRIEHFGSTAVPGLVAKPVIDILVQVRSLTETREKIAPVLEKQGYDYFWRPTSGDDTPPFYAWFIKRDANGIRTHHIHMVEAHFEHWKRLLFRDYLLAHPAVAREYGELKLKFAAEFPGDRVKYTAAKTEFILRVTAAAEKYFSDRKFS
ncbi:MAG: GrpB family protein [Kiritimatiellales bacterium]